MSKISNARIDRAGLALSRDIVDDVDEYFELEEVFDEYRKSHLQPLTETTLELQHWLNNYGEHYYIAQRLKRKPQIIRKLQRLSVRLTQLQDVGGCRIIVNKNRDVDNLYAYLLERITGQENFTLTRVTDYREKGRDDTGYRALHLMFTRTGRKLELQIRSRMQHYWAESIERTSVVYGYHLKEKEGAGIVIAYFRQLSNIFYEKEANREPTAYQKLEINQLKKYADKEIRASDKNQVFDSFVNRDIIKTLRAVELSKGSGFNNWLIVFDWNSGAFVSWEVIDRDPQTAIDAYVHKENQFTATGGYEVVLIGSSDVETVQHTHSHYFGVDTYESIFAGLDQSAGLVEAMDLDTDARQILLSLVRRNFWGNRKVSVKTLRNHWCKDANDFDHALKYLATKDLLTYVATKGTVALNVKAKNEINSYL
ncbi:MAG: RelA/SpoT domain-containing protein [Acidobacteria bacterium]|nr:RelA/SpoT domain-containing protein [Acidobacteriota bacterium]